MDDKEVIGGWIFEYLLRHSSDYSTLLCIERALPFPPNDLHLQKLVLLRKVEAEVSRDHSSETVLEMLEKLEGLGKGVVSEAMRLAYCAVAVSCTLSFRRMEDDDSAAKLEFFKVVERIWREKATQLEKTIGGLGSDLFWDWRDLIMGAVFDDKARREVLKMSEEFNAVELVKMYVREELEKLGPTILEELAESKKSGAGNEIRGDASTSRERQDDAGPSGIFLLSEMLMKIREAARFASMEVRAGVNDQLPDPLRFANANEEDVAPIPDTLHADLIQVVEEDPIVGDAPGVVQSEGDNADNNLNASGNDVVPSPSTDNAKTRRKGRKWTESEENVLRAGVQTYGVGRWKEILIANRDLLEGRNAVDLKDKWRNMIRNR